MQLVRRYGLAGDLAIRMLGRYTHRPFCVRFRTIIVVN